MDTEEFYKSRKETQEKRKRSVTQFHCPYATAEFPLLHSFVSQNEVAGVKRKLGKIILFAEDGRLKGCLKDQDLDQVLFVTLDGYEDAFQRLDRALADPDADWRASRQYGRR